MKERLVGAAVLVGLAVWLIPWVLDGPVPDTEFEAVQSPESGDETPLRTQTIRLDRGQVSAARTDAVDGVDARPMPGSTPAADTGLQRDSASAPETPVAPAAEASIIESTTEPPDTGAPGWVVQLGSFRDEENARQLADRVGELGYTANLSTYTASGEVWYRVRVGPEPDRERVDDIASSLIAQGLFPAEVVSSN